MRFGALEITLADGRVKRFGDDSTPIRVAFHDPDLPRKVVLNPELAVGEAYMDGRLTIQDDDLYGFLTLGVRNFSVGYGEGLEAKLAPLTRWVSQINPMGRARKNVAHHYDLSGRLYDLFLDEDKQYSCAYFSDPKMSLEDAQRAKKAHIAGKLMLKPDQHVLDIGCGWGGMAIFLAKRHDVHVTGITLSEEQAALAGTIGYELTTGLTPRVKRLYQS